MNEGALVQAVARALCLAEGEDPDWKPHWSAELNWRLYADASRAAITAYRKHMGETA